MDFSGGFPAEASLGGLITSHWIEEWAWGKEA